MKKYVIEKNNFQGHVITSLNNEGKSFYTGKTLAEMQLDYENELITITDEELDLYLENYYNSLQDNWKEISEDDYYDALECLPPMNWRTIVPGVNVFCISEAFTSHLHSHYLKLTNSEGAKYYTAIRSRFITNDEILNQIKSL